MAPKPKSQPKPEPAILPASVDADRILSFAEFCQLAGVSLPTARRLVKAEQGPIITRLSERRIGVRVKHAREWLDSRAAQPHAA